MNSFEVMRRTLIGGRAIKMVAGEDLVEGNCAAASTTVDGEVIKSPANSDNPIGIVYAAVSKGEDVWIVTEGIAEVLFDSAITAVRGDYVYVIATGGDVGTAGGQSTINTARHWGEIGHCIESAGGAGAVVKCVLHFN